MAVSLRVPRRAPLAAIASLIALAPATLAAAPHRAEASVPDSWQELVDDTDLLTVSVPPEWDDVSTDAVGTATGAVAGLEAATDMTTFETSIDGSGLRYLAIAYDPDTDAVIERHATPDDCATSTPAPYDDGAFAGVLVHWTDCGRSGVSTTEVYSLAASLPNRAYTLVLYVQITRADQREIVDGILASFNLTHLPPVPGTGGGATRLTDDLGALTLDVPAAWTETDLSPGNDGYGNQMPYLAASPDLRSFLPAANRPEDYRVPGVVFRVMPRSTDLRGLADGIEVPRCHDDGTEEYDDGRVAGYLRWFSDCAGTGTTFVALVADPIGADTYTVRLNVRVTDGDDGVLSQILGSLRVAPSTIDELMSARVTGAAFGRPAS